MFEISSKNNVMLFSVTGEFIESNSTILGSATSSKEISAPKIESEPRPKLHTSVNKEPQSGPLTHLFDSSLVRTPGFHS